MSDWQLIETAPVEPWTPELECYYRFRCLLQINISFRDGNVTREVCEGRAYYVPPRKGSTKGGLLRWANALGQCIPTYWMPLPAPRVEP